jgi:hypothetical protein
MLVGWTIHAAYETDAHNKTPRNGNAINKRRRRRPRPRRGWRRPAALMNGDERADATSSSSVPRAASERIFAASCLIELADGHQTQGRGMRAVLLARAGR